MYWNSLEARWCTHTKDCMCLSEFGWHFIWRLNLFSTFQVSVIGKCLPLHFFNNHDLIVVWEFFSAVGIRHRCQTNYRAHMVYIPIRLNRHVLTTTHGLCMCAVLWYLIYNTLNIEIYNSTFVKTQALALIHTDVCIWPQFSLGGAFTCYCLGGSLCFVLKLLGVWMAVCQLVSPPLWSTLNHLNNYCVGCTTLKCCSDIHGPRGWIILSFCSLLTSF